MKERFIKFFNKNFEFTDKGKIKYQSKNAYPTNNEIRIKFNEILELGGDDPITQEELEDWLKELTPELKHKVQKVAGLDYCASWIYQSLQAPNCPYTAGFIKVYRPPTAPINFRIRVTKSIILKQA